MLAFNKIKVWSGWPAEALTIAGCAAILAHAAAGALPAIPVGAPVHRSPPPVQSAPVDTSAILARNVFCSRCGAEGDRPPLSLAPRATNLPLALVAVLFAVPPSDGRSSLALVRDDAGRLSIVAVGDQVREALVVAISETRIHLVRDGRREFLDLLGTTAPGPAASPARGTSSGIRTVGERSFEIERATLESVLGDTTSLVQAARMVPEVREGRTVGIRLYAVRPDGILARIGLRSGDVLMAVNGLPIHPPERALDAFVKLRSASHLSLGIERDGHLVTLDYTIR